MESTLNLYVEKSMVLLLYDESRQAWEKTAVCCDRGRRTIVFDRSYPINTQKQLQ